MCKYIFNIAYFFGVAYITRTAQLPSSSSRSSRLESHKRSILLSDAHIACTYFSDFFSLLFFLVSSISTLQRAGSAWNDCCPLHILIRLSANDKHNCTHTHTKPLQTWLVATTLYFFWFTQMSRPSHSRFGSFRASHPLANKNFMTVDDLISMRVYFLCCRVCTALHHAQLHRICNAIQFARFARNIV